MDPGKGKENFPFNSKTLFVHQFRFKIFLLWCEV